MSKEEPKKYKATCNEICWDNQTIYYPHLLGDDKREIEYDIDPSTSIAIHFTFINQEAQSIRNANELTQKKRRLEQSLKVINRSLADEKFEKELELEKINNALLKTPVSVKNALDKKE